MGRIITYDCNASTERVFRSKTSTGSDRNISKDAVYKIFFDIIDSDTAAEKRQLRVVNINTDDVLLIDLNDAGGRKPINTGAQNKPQTNPNPRFGVQSDVETERVFYVGENLSDSSGIRVVFNFVRKSSTDDKIKFLVFTGTSVPNDLANRQVELNSDGGKKPLEGGGALRKKIVPRKK